MLRAHPDVRRIARRGEHLLVVRDGKAVAEGAARRTQGASMKDLRNISLFLSMLAAGLAACDPGPDPVDPGDPGYADAACETWYLDQDDDGHGDADDLGI